MFVDDEHDLIQSISFPVTNGLQERIDTVPLLLAESFRHLLAIDTDEHDDVNLKFDKWDWNI